MDDGTRTHDDRDHNPGLYQLSYAHHYRYRTKKLFRVDQRSSFNIAAGHRSSNTSSLKINSHDQFSPCNHCRRIWRARQDLNLQHLA